MSVYNTEPVKNNKSGEKPANTSTTTTTNVGVETKTVSYSTVSDFYYQNRGKLFDPDSGKYLDVGDFHKKMLSGAAGIVYNTLLLITVEGKAAQITLTAGRITASTVSLTADDVNLFAAVGISVATTAFKPTTATYKYAEPAFDLIGNELKASNSILANLTGQGVKQWTSFGGFVHQKYHELPHAHLPSKIFGQGANIYSPFTPLQWGEAGLAKLLAKKVVPGYKKEYQPNFTELGQINQSFIGNSTPVTEAGILQLNLNRDFVLNTNAKSLFQKDVEEKPRIDNTRYVMALIGDMRTTKQKLESFITQFENKKDKNIWFEQLDRIFQPEIYAHYDKAKRELKKITDLEKGGAKKDSFDKILSGLGFLTDIIFGDIAKSIAKVGKGAYSVQKLQNGIDYNKTFINQLARYKTDLEAAGGQFIIQSNGSFFIKTPAPPVQPTITLTTTITTNVGSGVSGDGGTTTTTADDQKLENYANRLTKIRGNESVIKGLIKSANKAKEDESKIENLKNKNNLFLTRYPFLRF